MFAPPPSPDIQPYAIRPPQIESPLQTLAQMGQLRAQQAQLQTQALAQQEARLGIQQKQTELENIKAANDAYKGAFTQQPDGTMGLDRNKLINALATGGHGSLIPGIQENLTKWDQSLATLQETRSKNAAAEADFAGSIGATVKAANYDPALFHTLMTHATAQNILPAANYQSMDQQLTQALQADPTGQQAKLLVKGWSDQFIAGSAKQQELETARLSAQRGAAAAEKEARDAAEKDYQTNISALIANPPASPLEYKQRVDQMTPATAKRIYGTVPAGAYDPQKSPDALRTSALTAEQMTVAAKPKAEPGVEVQALEASARLYAQQHGITLDPNKPALAQLPAEAAPGILSASKAATETPDTKAIRALTLQMAEARRDDLRDKQASVDGYVASMKQNPDMFHELSADEKGRVGAAWMRATGLPLPVKLDTQTQQRETGSHNVLQQTADIRAAIQDPAIQSRIGAILGRLGEKEMDVGATVGLTPEQAQKAQDLRSSMTYLLFGEGKSIFGARIPQQLIGVLQKTSPRVSEALPMIQGSLDAVERNARQNITTARQQRFGGKELPGYTDQFKATTPSAAPKTVTRSLLNQYAQQHGIDVQQAQKLFTDKGYQVTQ